MDMDTKGSKLNPCFAALETNYCATPQLNRPVYKLDSEECLIFWGGKGGVLYPPGAGIQIWMAHLGGVLLLHRCTVGMSMSLKMLTNLSVYIIFIGLRAVFDVGWWCAVGGVRLVVCV